MADLNVPNMLLMFFAFRCFWAKNAVIILVSQLIDAELITCVDNADEVHVHACTCMYTHMYIGVVSYAADALPNQANSIYFVVFEG